MHHSPFSAKPITKLLILNLFDSPNGKSAKTTCHADTLYNINTIYFVYRYFISILITNKCISPPPPNNASKQFAQSTK